MESMLCLIGISHTDLQRRRYLEGANPRKGVAERKKNHMIRRIRRSHDQEDQGSHDQKDQREHKKWMISSSFCSGDQGT